MKSRGWSLAGRLTAFFAVGTLLIVIANAIVTALFLRNSIETALEGAVANGLAEVEKDFAETAYRPDDFKEITDRIGESHAGLEMAWRVWNPDTGEVWGEFGRRDHLKEAAPTLDTLERTLNDGALWWRVTRFKSGHVVAMVVNGKSRLALLSEYELLVIKRVVASVAFAALISWLFMRRVSLLLRKVADDLRAESSGEPRLNVDKAPAEIVALTDALRQRLARVRDASEKAQLFTASLAHELRSPIQNLIGETEVALIAPRDAATYRAVLESNLHELRELGDAVDNLMTICTQRASDSKILREEFDLGDEAEIRLARERGRGRLIGVELDLVRTGNTRLVGDRESLLRALRNLAGNAIDFSPPGSRVEIAIVGEPDAIRVTVDDQGPGVPPELRERIFEAFFTGPAKQGGRLGYGLGLSIARTAAIGQGGTIDVSTNARGGASFRVILPRKPPTRRMNGS
ncbi:MAG: HAMP domain-containing histidine kinase [Planctomycetes bacterium]|nr:HAMP domain-containing histidine kinase [Planctomycetota bacterium]